MQKKSFFILLLFVVCTAKAQNLHITLFGGFSNYQGDLQEKGYTIDQAHPAFGFGVLYDITNHIAIRCNANFGALSGDDKYNPRNFPRNLNFSSPITDIHLGIEYSLLDLNRHRFSPYLFAGVSYFRINPSTKDSSGTKIYLQPLSTEGEGFYQGRKKYRLNQFAIPFGAGVKLAISRSIRVAFEIGMRKTNTDYLDDISTTYIDQNILLANRGQQAVDLAFRGGELKTGLTYPGDGSQRGKVQNKDWYYFSGFILSIKLPGINRPNSRKSKTGCPRAI
jgi:Domain of unknown function (DUF6089)